MLQPLCVNLPLKCLYYVLRVLHVIGGTVAFTQQLRLVVQVAKVGGSDTSSLVAPLAFPP